MKEILLTIGFLIIFLAPVVAIVWIIARLAKGSRGKGPSITGD